jgi:hypothetical protein
MADDNPLSNHGPSRSLPLNAFCYRLGSLFETREESAARKGETRSPGMAYRIGIICPWTHIKMKNAKGRATHPLKITLGILPSIRALRKLFAGIRKRASCPDCLTGIYAAARRYSGIAWPRKHVSRERKSTQSIPAEWQTRGKSLLSLNRYCSASRWLRSGPEIHSRIALAITARQRAVCGDCPPTMNVEFALNVLMSDPFPPQVDRRTCYWYCSGHLKHHRRFTSQND